MHYFIVPYCVVLLFLYCIALHFVVLYCIVIYFILLYSAVQNYLCNFYVYLLVERKPRCCTMTTSESEIEPESMESTVDDYESDDENEDDDDFDVEFLPNDAELDSLFSLDEDALTKSESESSDSDVVIEDDGTCLIDLHSQDEPNPKAVSQGYEHKSQLLIESLEDMNLIDFGESARTGTSMQQPSDQSNHELLVQGI